MGIKITDWAPSDRPREKLAERGAASLSEAELLGILIGSGTKKRSAVDLGREMLSMAENNLNILGKLDLTELKTLPGIGDAKAITIAAALELGRRRKLSEAPENGQIRSSADVFNLFHPMLADLPHEEFWTLYLNRSNRPVSRLKVSQGGISGTVTDVRLIMKRAVELLASGMVVCHNHPSGNTNPSESDLRITKKIKEAGELLDIQLLDHIIIAGTSYYSFADNGTI